MKIIRVIVLIVFSAIIVQTCVALGFWLRYVIDSAYTSQNTMAMTIVNGLGGWYGKTILGISFIPSFLLIYLLSKILKFSNPFRIAISIIIPVLWLNIYLGGISVPVGK